jgi:putative addiction module component (TIGR02574 family)
LANSLSVTVSAMSTDSTFVFDAALNLSDDDRASLAYQLLQSLKPAGIRTECDPQLDEELERRLNAYESNQSGASDWQDVVPRLRQILHGNKTS